MDHGAKPELSRDQRNKLRSYFVAEQQKQELIADTGQFVTTISQISKIASNLGIKDPNINQAINYASVAQNALANVATGNYIGAILSVTSVFGGSKPDPEQERFRAIMAFLQQLDKKLDQIIDLQKQTIEAVQKLSVQVAVLGKQLNNRLDHVDFELRRIADGLSTVMWGSLVECGVAWSQRNRSSGTFNDVSREFSDVQKLVSFVLSNTDDTIKCGKDLRDLFVKVKNTTTFGRPLSLQLAAQTDFSITPGEKDTTLSRSDLERFLQEVHGPAREILLGNWDPHWGPPATLFAFLASPAATVPAVRERLAGLQEVVANAKPFRACSAPTLLSWRLRSFVCTKGLYAPRMTPTLIDSSNEQLAEQTTKTFLDDPFVRDQLFDLANWTTLIARPFDFWTGQGSNIYTLAGLGEGKGEPRGKDLIWGAASILDIAIAQQAMLSGDINSKFIYAAIWEKGNESAPGIPKKIDNKSPPLAQIANKLLRNPNNPWLARNVLMFVLDDALRIKSGDPSIPYQDAVNRFLSIPNSKAPDDKEMNAGTLFMRSIFRLPEDAKFSIEDTATPTGVMRKLFLSFGDLKIEMPPVEMFRTRSLIYPKSVSDLIALRDQLGGQFVDYEFLNTIEDAEQNKRVATILLVGLATYGQPSKP